MNIKTHKPYNKAVLALLMASILIGSILVGIASGFISGQSTVAPWNADFVTLEGVAANDYYKLDSSRQYSYDVNQWAVAYEEIPNYPELNPVNTWFTAGKSLRIGMTEYAEFATQDNTGIAYGATATEWWETESWASTGIPNPANLIQGWTFYMNYTRAQEIRQILAYAVFSNMVNEEAGRGVVSWVGTLPIDSPSWTPVMGELTPSGIQVLYDSARLVVVRAMVTITDNNYGNGEDVAQITFTVIMNKDTKYAIVYKDLKILIDPKVLDRINDLAFSERYEIDIARNINSGNRAYIHWFKDYNDTTYMHPLTSDNKFDVVQAFDPGRRYIFFAAYWPNTTECSVSSPLVPNIGTTAALRNTRVLDRGTMILDLPDEPNTPWVIAQWRYQSISPNLRSYFPNLLDFLAKGDPAAEEATTNVREIRFVEVIGMTDYHKGTTGALPVAFRALDINATDASNNVDVEVRFLLANVFNPQTLGNTLEEVEDEPFLWVGLGQSAATTDSAGGVAMSDFGQYAQNEPLGLFDKNDTAFPWTAANPYYMKGTIPFGLDWTGNFAGDYMETFNNVAKGTGNDDTDYIRTGLNGFAFKVYDGETPYSPQPIAGGFSKTSDYWYPSKNPLNERWSYSPFVLAPYYDAPDNGIITLGGVKANGLTRYFNDFNFAITREGDEGEFYALIDGGTVEDEAPTSDPALNTLDYFPLSSWASSKSTFDYQEGTAVIAVGRDINGTRGLSVYGWDGRDTYWASAWASQFLSEEFHDFLPEGCVALVLDITYSAADREPTGFTIVKALGTITEFGTNIFYDGYGGFDVAAMNAVWDGELSGIAGPDDATSTLPANDYYKEWWYAKLPTITIAAVEFDP